MPYMESLQRRWAVLRQVEMRETLRDFCSSLDSLHFMLPVDVAGGGGQCAAVWPTMHASKCTLHTAVSCLVSLYGEATCPASVDKLQAVCCRS